MKKHKFYKWSLVGNPMGKLNKKNINFEKIEDILYVMRRPHRDVNYVSADEEMS